MTEPDSSGALGHKEVDVLDKPPVSSRLRIPPSHFRPFFFFSLVVTSHFVLFSFVVTTLHGKADYTEQKPTGNQETVQVLRSLPAFDGVIEEEKKKEDRIIFAIVELLRLYLSLLSFHLT